MEWFIRVGGEWVALSGSVYVRLRPANWHRPWPTLAAYAILQDCLAAALAAVYFPISYARAATGKRKTWSVPGFGFSIRPTVSRPDLVADEYQKQRLPNLDMP